MLGDEKISRFKNKWIPVFQICERDAQPYSILQNQSSPSIKRIYKLHNYFLNSPRKYAVDIMLFASI